MTPRRLEQVDVTDIKSKDLGESPESGGALSGADRPIFEHFGPDLQQVIDAWADLPEPVRTGILVMVAFTGKGIRPLSLVCAPERA